MANLKEIRRHIASVKSMQQITRSMKMVSASKLRKAQDAIIQMRPYDEKLYELLMHVANNIDITAVNQYAVHKDTKRVLLVAVTSNRGLCGSFNSNIVKKIIDLAEQEFGDLYQRRAVDILAIGKKGIDLLTAKEMPVVFSVTDIYDNFNFKNVSNLANMIMDDYVSGKYDKVILVFNQFRNAVVQDLIIEQFLPIKIEERKEHSFNGSKRIYFFEPSMQGVVDTVIPKSLKIHFYRMMLDSIASEHGARMTAMHKATDNATELAKELNLHYNKARQSSITNEILEIVSGAEALKG